MRSAEKIIYLKDYFRNAAIADEIVN